MKKVIAWIKGRLLIVVCVVLILLFLPAGYVLSGMWNASIQKQAQDDFQTEQRKLKSKATVSYALPAVFQGEQSISEARAPNRAVTDFFKRQRDAREQQVAQVVELATEFNERGHELLIPGLLPEPADDYTRRRLIVEMVRAISGEQAGDGVLPLFRRMLDAINAGPPIPADQLADTLAEYERTQREKIEAASPTGKLTPEQEDELTEQLKQQRLGAYATRASELSLYASPDVFYNRGPNGAMGVFEPDPARITESQFDENDAFAWQFDIWVISDLLAGLERANTGPSGERASIVDGVAKRLELLEVLPFTPDPQTGAVAGAPMTHTGRTTTRDNQVYDVRHARMVVVADAQRVPALVEAMGVTNFITVTGVRAQRVDPWQDLGEGYYYGPDPILRLTLDVEVVYLRDWTKRSMPPTLRQTLGIPDEGAADQAEIIDD